MRVALPRAIAALAFGLLAAIAIVRTNGGLALAEAGRTAEALALSPHSAVAHRLAAIEALQRGQSQSARTHALAALAEAPLDQTSATIVAITSPPAQSLAMGNLSAALGWRDAPTQLLLAQGAAVEGKWDLFAQRIDAYARLQPDMRESGPVLDRAMAEGPARAALARRLALAPPWRDAYFLTLDAGVADAAINRVALVRQIVAAGGRLRSDEVRETVRRLLDADAPREAMSVWRAYAPSPTLLIDEAFERVGAEASSVAFEWAVPEGARGFSVREETPEGRPALHLEHDGTGSGPMLAQTLVLPPGRYALEVTDAAAPPPDGFGWQLRCGNDDLLGVDPVIRATRMAFTVPAGCALQQLAIVARPTSGAKPVDLWLARARVTPEGPHR